MQREVNCPYLYTSLFSNNVAEFIACLNPINAVKIHQSSGLCYGNYNSLIKVIANSVYANPAMERPAVAQIHGMKLK